MVLGINIPGFDRTDFTIVTIISCFIAGFCLVLNQAWLYTVQAFGRTCDRVIDVVFFVGTCFKSFCGLVASCGSLIAKRGEFFPGNGTVKMDIGAKYSSLPDVDVSAEVCKTLQRSYLQQGFLNMLQRDSYCSEHCAFASVSCDTQVKVESADGTKLLESGVTIIRQFFESERTISVDLSIDEGTQATWVEIALSFSPILFSLLPIIMNQYKVYGRWQAFATIIVFVVITFVYDLDLMMATHNCVVAVLCLVHPAGSIALLETGQMFIPLACLIFLIFIPGQYFQLFVFSLTIFGFGFLMRWFFFVKKQSHMSAFVGFMQILVLWEQLKFVRESFAERSLIGSGLELCIRAMLPDGDTRVGVFNIINFSKRVSMKLPFVADNKLFCFMFLTFFQFFAFVGFRAALGQYSMVTLRFKVGMSELQQGLLVYMCDLFGPVRCIYRLLFGIENLNRRRISYATVFLCISVYEYQCALEVFMLRLLFSFLDYVVFDSGKARATKYLGESLDMMERSFPNDGSFPWNEVDKLLAFRGFTGIIDSVGDKTLKGVGVAIRVAGEAKLYALKHVVKGVKSMSFCGLDQITPLAVPLTGGDDPVVVVDLSESYLRPPECCILLRQEAGFIKHLMFINVSDSDSVVTFIPPGSFKVEGNSISACVELKPGDIGGPLFGVLNDGNLRYCGMVSKGMRKKGAGNVVTFVYGDGCLSFDSDSDDDSSLNSSEARRLGRVNMASTKTCAEREADYKELISSLKDSKELLTRHYLKYDEIWIDPEDCNCSEKAYGEYVTNRYPLIERGGDETAESRDASARKIRQRRKLVNKDRVTWKERTLMCETVWLKLTNVYDGLMSARIFDRIVNDDDWPNLFSSEYICGCSDGCDWMYGDELPSIDWN